MIVPFRPQSHPIDLANNDVPTDNVCWWRMFTWYQHISVIVLLT